jgi:ribosomal protein L7/L12
MLTGVDHPWIVLACVVIVLVAVLVALRRPRYRDSGPVKPVPPASGPVTLPDDGRAEIDRLVVAGQKIQAIKLLRTSVPGLSLKDAKDRVDAWHTTRGIDLSKPAAGPATADATWAGLAPDVVAEIDRYIAGGKLIQAIKLVREHTHWGLVEAKQWVDARAGR